MTKKQPKNRIAKPKRKEITDVKMRMRLLELVDIQADQAKRDNDDALRTLWSAASLCVNHLADISASQPERVRPLARESIYWPHYRSIWKRDDCGFDDIREEIELGKNVPIRRDGKNQMASLHTSIAAVGINHVRTMLMPARVFFENPKAEQKKHPEVAAYYEPFKNLASPITEANRSEWWTAGVKPFAAGFFPAINKSYQAPPDCTSEAQRKAYFLKHVKQSFEQLTKS